MVSLFLTWPGAGPASGAGGGVCTCVSWHVEATAVHEHLLDAARVAEQVSLHHDEVRDLAGLEAAEPVLDTIDGCCVEGEGPQRGVGGQAGLDGLADGGEELTWTRQAVGIERKRYLLAASAAGVPGALSRSSSVRSNSSASGSASFGFSGHFALTSTGTFALAIRLAAA